MDCGPMRASIGRKKNGPVAADDPADSVRRSRTRGQVRGNVAGLPRPRGPAIARKFDHADMTDAPETFPAGSVDQVLNEAASHEGGRSPDIFAKSRGGSGGGRRRSSGSK